MSELHDPILEAAEALRTYGIWVEPWGESYPLWLVDGQTMTGADMLALAVRLGLMDSTATKLQ